MDRVAITGDLGKASHVGGIDGLLKHLGHADREVFKIKHLQRQHFTDLRVVGAALGLGGVPQFLLHVRRLVQWLFGLSAIILSDAIPAMMLIRFAISIFALTLRGLAISLSAAQSEQETNPARAATFIHQ